MTRMTSAYANKLIRKLKEDKFYWTNREEEGHCYVAALDEEPVIPEYDYLEVSAKIAEIDQKIITIKHALNVVNTTNEIQTEDGSLTIDAVLVKMAQLNQRKVTLDKMRKLQPKTRMNTSLYSSRKTTPEYQYINFDMDLIKKEYEAVDMKISAMQIALDKFNQTFEFDVNI